MVGEKAKFAEDVMTAANRAEQSVSVSIEDVEPNDRAEMVYKPDRLDKKPRYNRF
jgi:4-oxalocrotonate tautomerase